MLGATTVNDTLPLNSLAMLIVEDQRSADLFCDAAQGAGFSIHICRDGSAAIDALDTLQPILVILDMDLAYGFGLKILNHIRHVPQLKSSWVVLVTADPARAELVREIDDFIMAKPVSFDQMRDLSRRLRRFKI
jgi:DNA-binding response OmpR family regulator